MSVKRAFFSAFQKIMVFCCAIFFRFADAFSANLPSGYTELEYIESTGTQWIDTGISFVYSDALRIVADMQYTDLPSGASQYFGIYGGAYFGVTNSSWSVGGNAQGTANTTRHVFDFSTTIGTNQVQTLKVDNVSYANTRNNQNGRVGVLNTVSGTYFNHAKLYSVKIYKNSSLTFDGIPAKYGNVVGMYDTVSGTFFTNAGTGTFTAGPVAVTNSGPISSVTVAGLVAQNGTPTPTTPIDIVSNNGVLKVSKNLFTTTMTQGTIGANDGRLYPGRADRVSSSDFISVTPNTQYTFSYVATSISYNGIYFYQNDGTYISYATTNTFTTPVNATKVKFTLGRSGGNALVPADVSKIQLELGSTATPYMPYGQIYTDGEVETIGDSANHTATVATLLGVGDYRDTQNINTGAITRNVGVKVLDGTEDWRNVTTNTFYATLSDVNYNATVESICTHYSGVVPTVSATNQPDKTIKAGYFTQGQGYNRIYIKDSVFADYTNLKQYLAEQYAAGTPVIVVYPLATETTESVAGQTMTTAPVNNRTGGVAGMTITTLLSSGASIVTTIATNAIKIATTAYNAARFNPVVNDLNSTVATIRDIVTNTINQTAAIASLQADKQTRPEDACPAGKKCLLVETEENGVIVPHWFPIIEAPEDN